MSTNIKVCVRVRPENAREKSSAQRPVVAVMDESMLVFDPVYDESVTYFHGRVVKDPTSRKPREAKFAFDRVFGPSATNIEVYEQTTKKVLRALVEGYNCSVFAYGATGAGKTFSMLGSPQTPGVIFLSMMDLYNIKESEKDERRIDVTVSYLEVYNENIKDLLSPGSGNLPIRENGKQGVVVAGLSVREPNSAEELLQMLEKGNKNRTQHPTDANAESSRSHAVFQVFVRVKSATTGLTEDVKVSKLSLIDLAGSERATVTKNKGARLREGANINKSLLALGNCINALADTKRKGTKHVPYRNSKLTRILKDSLGDNCKTVMLAAVSPSRQSYEDTYNTLSYADRAKKIKAVLKKNVFSVASHVQNYGKVVDELQAEVTRLKEQLKKQTEQLSEQASLSDMTPLAAATPCVPAVAPVIACEFDIDQLQTDISKTYGERRQIRDDILHIESMQKHVDYTIIRKQRVLDRLEMMSSKANHGAGNQTISKVTRALSSAVNKQQNLERTKTYELSQLSDNTATLKQLVQQGVSVDNLHAQQILSLQMKCYNYEQESREYQKENQYLHKLVNTMYDEQVNNERMLSMFVEFLSTSEGMLSQYGLQSDELTAMYQNVREVVVNERRVQFDNQEKDKAETQRFKTLLSLPVVSANENSVQLTGEPILIADQQNAAADTTVTIENPMNGTFVLDQPASSCDDQENDQDDTGTQEDSLHTPPSKRPKISHSTSPVTRNTSSIINIRGAENTQHDEDTISIKETKCPSPTVSSSTEPLMASPDTSDDIAASTSTSIFTTLRQSPRFTSAAHSKFKPVHEVLALVRGTGCSEQEQDDDDVTSECKPAKLRVISRSDANSPTHSPDSNEDPEPKPSSTFPDVQTTPVVSAPDQPRHRLSYTVTKPPEDSDSQLNPTVDNYQCESEPMEVSFTTNSPLAACNATITIDADNARCGNVLLPEVRTPTLNPDMTFADAVKSPAAVGSQPLTQINVTPPTGSTASIPGYLKMTKASNSKRSKSSLNRKQDQENAT